IRGGLCATRQKAPRTSEPHDRASRAALRGPDLRRWRRESRERQREFGPDPHGPGLRGCCLPLLFAEKRRLIGSCATACPQDRLPHHWFDYYGRIILAVRIVDEFLQTGCQFWGKTLAPSGIDQPDVQEITKMRPVL